MESNKQQEEQKTAPEQIQEQPTQPIKKPKPKWLIPVIVVGIIILAAGAWAGYKYWLKPAAPEEQPSQEQEQPTEEEPDEFADWKTYRNEKFGFEIKYPSDFIVKDAETMIFAFETPDSEFQELYNDYYKQNFSFRMNGAEFYIGAHIHEEKPTTTEWIDKERWNEMLSDYSGTVSSINNLTVVFDEWSGWGAPTNDVHQFLNFLQENNKNTEDFYPYYKTFSFYNEKTGVNVGISLETIESKKISYNPIFDKILFTFKFIEPDEMSNIFKFENIKIGDRIADMTIEAIESVSSGITPNPPDIPIGPDNLSIHFSGETTITGEYYYLSLNIYGGNPVCFKNLEGSSKAKIPKQEDDTKKTGFCFINQDFAKNEFMPENSSGKATIVIDEYHYVRYPAGFTKSAKLIRIID